MGSTKNVAFPYKILNAGDMSQATLTAGPQTIPYLDNVAFQANWTGAPTGDFAVEASLDGVNYVGIPMSAPVTAAGSPDVAMFYLYQLPFQYVKVVYTKGSGTGSLDIYWMAKGTP